MSRVALSAVILTLDVAAIAGNAIVILAFIMNRKLRKPSGCYVTNLAAADLCMSLVGIPFYVTTVIQNHWPLGDYFCAVWTGLERVCSLVSNFAIVAICFDRYWLVTKSSHYLSKHSVKNARWRIAGIWIMAILLRVPFVIYGTLETWGKLSPLSVCDPKSSYDVPFQVGLYEYDTIYTLIATLGEFVIPLMLITVWGAQVYIYLEKREKQKLIKAVERSRAMSLDFTFPQRELAYLNDERRGSNQSRSSFWSRLLVPDGPKKTNANGLSRSRDTIAGPLSDLDEDPREDKCCSQYLNSQMQNGDATGWNSGDKSSSNSKRVNIVLDTASAGSDNGSKLFDDQISSSDKISRAANKSGLYDRNKSNLNTIGRKSVSLNTLQASTEFLQPLANNPKAFPTSKSTPSIILTTFCDDHNEVSTPGVVRKGGHLPLQVSFSLEVDEKENEGESSECQKQTQPDSKLEDSQDQDNQEAINLLQVGGTDKTVSSPGSSPAKKPPRVVVRDGSTASSCDFLDVPPRTHYRPQTKDGDSDTSPNDTTSSDGPTSGGLDGASLGGATVEAATNGSSGLLDTRNSSFSSCVSDLPDSVSSIITVSEPPSPGMRRPSAQDLANSEAIQKVLNSRARQRYRSYRRRALMTILLMICVFVVFQLPYVIASNVYSFCTSDCIPDPIYELVNWWYWAKILLNPFLYAYISPEFRRYSLGILRCKSVDKS